MVDAAAVVVVTEEDAVAAEAEVEVLATAAAIEIIKTLVIILVRIISNLNIRDMDIENVIRITEMWEGIREAVAVEVEEVAVVEVIAEILAQVTVRIIIRIIIRVTVRITIINSRSIPAREIRTEVTIGVVGITIRTEGKVEEGEAEFKVDGIRVPTIPVRIAINGVATIGAEADNIEKTISHIFLTIIKVSRKEKKL